MKCELAAVLLRRPRVLFHDPPTIGLDLTMQQQVRRFVADCNARHGATVVLTLHGRRHGARRLPVVDVAIEDVPVEEIVAEPFAAGAVDPRAALGRSR